MQAQSDLSTANIRPSDAQIVPYEPAHADGVRSLFLKINRELTLPGLEQAFMDYVDRALREEICKIAEYYDGERGNGFWVMVLGDVVIGFVGLERQTSEIGELRRMYLDAAFRGRGLADRLLERAETEARKLGYGLMALSTAEIQRSALAFYRRNGFHEVRQDTAREASHKAVGHGLRRIYFEKRLNPATQEQERPVDWGGPSRRATS
jgi:GNAT superfamily N-acetyltransferase